MNAISGASQAGSIMQVMLKAPVRPVRAILANDQRAASSEVDRYVPSAQSRPAASLTYGRNGQGGQSDFDGDGD